MTGPKDNSAVATEAEAATEAAVASEAVAATEAVEATEAAEATEAVEATEAEQATEAAEAPKSATAKSRPKPVGFGEEELAEVKKMERLHCSARQVPSPMGGFLMYLGVREELNGTSTVLFECKTSALRFQLPLRISTWRERRKVRIQADDGLDPLCPRGELGPRLVRRGKDFFCPKCSIMFGRAP